MVPVSEARDDLVRKVFRLGFVAAELTELTKVFLGCAGVAESEQTGWAAAARNE